MRLKKILLSAVMLMLLTACGRTTEEPNSKTIFAMDTVMTLTAYCDDAILQNAIEEIYGFEEIFSASKENSDIYVLNDEKTARVDENTLLLMKRAAEMAELTQGAFDPTIYPLVEEWGFVSEEFKVPSQEKINELLGNVDYNYITFDGNTISLENKNAKVDLGGIAKGYTSQRVIELLKENGVTSALVNLGGNVQTLGTKPDGSKWRVAIQNPFGDDYIGIIDAENKAVITSGGYQRYFEENDIIYHHILDTETGYPAENGLKSVTIVSEDGAMADSLSTAVFVMGYDRAVELWKNQQNFDMVLVNDDGEIFVTETLEADFTCTLGEYQVIK